MTDQKLDDLRQNIPIVDLAQKLGLEVRRNQARCFNSQAHAHGDKNPSLSFNTKTNRFRCWACNKNGSVIDLYKEIKGVDTKTAINELSEGRIEGAFKYKPLPPPQPKKLAGEYSEVYERLMLFCSGRDKETTDYLTGVTRGLNEAILDRFNLFSIKNYQETSHYLKKSFDIETLKRSGLFNDEGNFIFFRHKVIIPFYDNDKIVYLIGRNLDGSNPKYLNIKGIEKPLFNLGNLRKLKPGDKVYICEGVLDAIRLEQEGYNAVAILGETELKPNEKDLLMPYNIVLTLDNDKKGYDLTDRITKVFTLRGKSVEVKQLPEGIKDITDYFLSLQNDK